VFGSSIVVISHPHVFVLFYYADRRRQEAGVRICAAMTDDLLRALGRAVGAEWVVTDPASRAAHETDWTGRFHGEAAAVVRPGTAAEVAAVVAVCRAHRVGLVAQGGNTGLVGASVPRHGEVVLDLRRFDTIEPVDVAARQVTVGAGVRLADLQHAAATAGLRYAVDFGARDTATVGGSIATNAGGINLLRFGGTREQVVGIEAVLGTGAVVSRLCGLLKDNTGYHLPGLLCGSEGTLGVLTRARLRLVPLHAERVTALVGLGSIDEAVAAVVTVRDRVASLEAAEIVLADGVDLVCHSFDWPAPFARPWPAYLLFEAADDDDPADELAAALAGISGLGDVAVATMADGSARRDALWRYREHHTLAVRGLGPTVKLDVTVPLHAIGTFMTDLPEAVRAVDLAAHTWLFGHVADGNLHVNITGHRADDAARVHALEGAVLERVVALGGCISAEHGIGVLKAPWLHLDRSPDEIATMRAIKHALDPDDVLNPGVLFEEDR
jgi:FAD/FMN-containing dehydrogenase